MLANLGDVFKGFVVGVNVELGRPHKKTQMCHRPNHNSSFEVDGRPVAFGVKGGKVYVHDGVDKAVRLILSQNSAEAVDACVTVTAKRASAVGQRVPIREHNNRGLGQLSNNFPGDGFLR